MIRAFVVVLMIGACGASSWWPPATATSANATEPAKPRSDWTLPPPSGCYTQSHEKKYEPASQKAKVNRADIECFRLLYPQEQIGIASTFNEVLALTEA